MRTSRNIVPIIFIVILIVIFSFLAWRATTLRQEKGVYDEMAATSTNARDGASNDDLQMIKNDFSKASVDNSGIDADLKALEDTAQAASKNQQN